VEITYADNARAKELLGYEPTTSIEEGMKKFIKWYEQNETASSQN
jgi:UDP-glucose 4-epimerase